MDVIKEILLILKTLQPGALSVIAVVAIAWAASKVVPYIFKTEQAKIVLQTKKVEVEAEHTQQDGLVISSLGSALKDLATVLKDFPDQFERLVETLEKGNAERNTQSMEIMMSVKSEHYQKIDAIQQTIQTVPALIIEAQQPHLSALDTSIQTAMITLEKNVIARLERAEEYIPTAVKATVAEVIREELSKLVIKESEHNGNKQPSVGNLTAGGFAGSVDPGSADGPVLDGAANSVGSCVDEKQHSDNVSSGSANRPLDSGSSLSSEDVEGKRIA